MSLKKVIIVPAVFLLLFGGCYKVVNVPVAGGASYSECKFGECNVPINFEPDSILVAENASDCKSIFYAGEIFVLGDNFSHLWVGEIDDTQIEFKKYDIKNSPVSDVFFDWRGGNLVIGWTSSTGEKVSITVNSEGKIRWKR